MATQDQIEKVVTFADAITATPIDALIVNPNWGTINFELARAALEMTFALCNHIKVLPIELLPDSVANGFLSSMTQASQAVDKVRTFNIETGNPTGARDQIVNEIKQSSENLLVTTQGWIPFLAYQKGDIQKNIDALTQSVKDAANILGNAKIEVEERKKDIAGIVTAAREASASAGVGVFTSDFDGRASELEVEARRWLTYAVVLAVASLAAALASYFLPIAKDASNAQIFQHMTSKLVVLLVLITATVWCGKIFKALKHQATVNSHRANALKTFQAFVKASSDDNTRDAVLLETTRSIFALSPSGYLEASDPTSDSPTKVMEIFKGAGIGSK